MKEIYEKLLIDIELIAKEDVITTSASFEEEEEEHDNAYIDWDYLQ